VQENNASAAVLHVARGSLRIELFKLLAGTPSSARLLVTGVVVSGNISTVIVTGYPL
jgi:hypothetical protein